MYLMTEALIVTSDLGHMSIQVGKRDVVRRTPFRIDKGQATTTNNMLVDPC